MFKKARDHYDATFIVLFFHVVAIPLLLPFSEIRISLFSTDTFFLDEYCRWS